MPRARGVPTRSAPYWESRGKQMALSLYAFARDNVPAYRSYLQKHGVPIDKSIRSVRAFAELPIVTKDSYLRAHPYEDLFPPLAMHTSSTVSATSGSTGQPFFFPRGAEHDALYRRSMEVLLSHQWDVGKRSTLCIIGFGLGIWIGGVFTYKVFNQLAESTLPMTLVPVGPHKQLYLSAFKKFAAYYDQIILMGYPPFIKDMLDAGAQEGIQWSSHRIRILTAAEGYSERFRNHLSELSGADPVRDMVNIYGTVEQGTIAHETALTNMIRRIATERTDVFESLFPDAQNIPTLAQYYPDHVYFEEVDGQLVATGAGSAIPLVRYAFNDLGGVIPFKAMQRRFSSLGIDLKREIEKNGIGEYVLELPFVYVHARADFALVLQGANIYPEEIRTALDSRVLESAITGKFTAVRTEDAEYHQVLELHVELRKGARSGNSLAKKIMDTVVAELRAHNSEYNNNYVNDPARSMPHVILHAHGDPEYFSGQGKQQWVKKN